MNMKSRIGNRFKGYTRTFKGKYLLLQNKTLSDEEFILWDFSFSVLADWDKNHLDKYGEFFFTQDQIAEALGWHKTKVNRLSQSLSNKGLWQKQGDRKIRVVGFEIQESFSEITKKKGVINLQEYISNIELQIPKIKHKDSEIKHFQSKDKVRLTENNVPKTQQIVSKAPLVSSKVNVRSTEEYERIIKEENLTGMTPDDLAWIDNNLTEE